MECPDRHLFGLIDADQLFQPFAHLARRFIGESHGQDTPGRDMLVLDKVGDTVGDDTCLATARPGQDQAQAPVWWLQLCVVAH